MINGAGRVETTAEVIGPAELGYKRGIKTIFHPLIQILISKSLKCHFKSDTELTFSSGFFPKTLKFLI